MKKFKVYILIAIAVFSPLGQISAEDAKSTNTEREIDESDQSIEMMKKWQHKYLKQQKRHEAQARRVLFKDPTSTDSKRYEALAQEAKANADALQDQIESMLLHKENLAANP